MTLFRGVLNATGIFSVNIYFFAALAGGVQTIAPDRWMPISVFVWQKGWSSWRIAAFSFLIFTLHVGLGFALYAGLAGLLSAISEDNLGIFSLLFLGWLERFAPCLFRDFERFFIAV